jgi:primosomal protein N'
MPDGMTVGVGSIVRVKVSGRRLAGYVTAVFEAPEGRKLSPIESVTGSAPVFDDDLLGICRWAAGHYVAPLSTVLKRTAPPNAPRHLVSGTVSQVLGGHRTVGGRKGTYVVSASPHHEALDAAIASDNAATEIGGPKSARAYVVPSAAEAHNIAAHLREAFGDRVLVATSSMAARDVTSSWVAASQDPQTILVGTREIALWMLAGGGLWTIVEEGRRVMKSPATPTLHARDIVVRRSAASGTELHMVGPVPTLEAVASGIRVVRPSGRSWPVVEVVDRTEEAPGPALVTERARIAISGAAKAGVNVFILVAARGYAPAFRCLSCSELRRCLVCGTSSSQETSCRRCDEPVGPCRACGKSRFAPLGAGIGRIVDEVATFVGQEAVGTVDDARVVTVGSERDLVELGEIGLGVVLDVDGMAGAPHYRAREDALRLIVRLAHHVSPGSGHRLLLQTSAKEQPVVKALIAGRSDVFLSQESASREAASFPPFGELVAVEVRDGHNADQTLRAAIGFLGTVRGPAAMADRERWLIQGDDLTGARIALRSAVGVLRSQGARVRVDADPIDL